MSLETPVVPVRTQKCRKEPSGQCKQPIGSASVSIGRRFMSKKNTFDHSIRPGRAHMEPENQWFVQEEQSSRFVFTFHVKSSCEYITCHDINLFPDMMIELISI